MLSKLFRRRRKRDDRKQCNLLLHRNVHVRLKMLAIAMGVNMYDLADYLLDDGLSRWWTRLA